MEKGGLKRGMRILRRRGEGEKKEDKEEEDEEEEEEGGEFPVVQGQTIVQWLITVETRSADRLAG